MSIDVKNILYVFFLKSSDAREILGHFISEKDSSKFGISPYDWEA